jgi:hypothetical protein
MTATLAGKLAVGGISASLLLGAGTVAGAAVGIGPFQHETATRTGTPTPGPAVSDVKGDETETHQFVSIPDGASQTFTAGDAGTVTVRRPGDGLSIVTVNPAAGFTIVKQESGPGELQVELINGTVSVRFDAQVEHGIVQIRIRQHGVEPPATTLAPTATPTSEPPEAENEPPDAEDQIEAAAVDNEQQQEPKRTDVENQPEDQHGATPSAPSNGGDHSGGSGHDGRSSGGGD